MQKKEHRRQEIIIYIYIYIKRERESGVREGYEPNDVWITKPAWSYQTHNFPLSCSKLVPNKWNTICVRASSLKIILTLTLTLRCCDTTQIHTWKTACNIHTCAVAGRMLPVTSFSIITLALRAGVEVDLACWRSANEGGFMMVEMHVYVKFKHEIQQQKTAEGSQEQNIWIKLQLIRAHMEIGAQLITPRLWTSFHSRSDAVITGPILSENVRIRTLLFLFLKRPWGDTFESVCGLYRYENFRTKPLKLYLVRIRKCHVRIRTEIFLK